MLGLLFILINLFSMNEKNIKPIILFVKIEPQMALLETVILFKFGFFMYEKGMRFKDHLLKTSSQYLPAFRFLRGSKSFQCLAILK